VLYVLAAANVPKIAPNFNFPYSNVILSILGVVLAVMILVAMYFVMRGLIGTLQAMSGGGHGGAGEPMKLVGASIVVLALLFGFVGVLTTTINWLGI
jgi:hypothetical protein